MVQTALHTTRPGRLDVVRARPVRRRDDLRPEDVLERELHRRRVDRLSLFLGYATIRARHEDDPGGWWSKHVIWAINRLTQLGYRFPEVDDAPLRRVA